MTRSEREHLIERYLDGAMSVDQEHDLFIEAATNKELRAELKAYRVIDHALRKDSAVEPAGYSAVRAHMQGLLAASTATAAAGQSAPGIGRSGRMRLRNGKPRPTASQAPRLLGRLAAVPMKMLVIVATAAACTMGTLIVVSSLQHTVEPSRRPMQAPSASGAIVPVRMSITSVRAALAGAAAGDGVAGADTVQVSKSLPDGIAGAVPESSASHPPDRGLHRGRRGYHNRPSAPQPAPSVDGADRSSTNRRANTPAHRGDNPRIPFIIQTPRREN